MMNVIHKVRDWAERQLDERRRLVAVARVLLTLSLVGGAVWLLCHALRGLDWHVMLRDCWNMPWHRLVLAALCTAISYGALTFYDLIGCRWVGCGVSYAKVAYAALLAYALSHTLGFPAVTGGAVRYRLYAAWGVKPATIARIMGLAGLTLIVGLLGVGGTMLAFTKQSVEIHWLGVLLLAGLGLYGAIGHWRGSPNLKLTLTQALVGGTDWLCVAATLYVLLPASIDLSFPAFAGLFVMAYLVATISNVPGGLGIFESLILTDIGGDLSTETLVSALLVYRAIYFLIPFTLAGIIFLVHEARGVSGRLKGRVEHARAREREYAKIG